MKSWMDSIRLLPTRNVPASSWEVAVGETRRERRSTRRRPRTPTSTGIRPGTSFAATRSPAGEPRPACRFAGNDSLDSLSSRRRRGSASRDRCAVARTSPPRWRSRRRRAGGIRRGRSPRPAAVGNPFEHLVPANGLDGPRRDLLRAARQLVAPCEVDLDWVVQMLSSSSRLASSSAANSARSSSGRAKKLVPQGDRSCVHGIRLVRPRYARP
jgi:hypothetical protein